MHEESVDDYLEKIFGNRRWCPDCGAMTPALGNGVLAFCECCRRAYDFPYLRDPKNPSYLGLSFQVIPSTFDPLE